MSQLVIKMKQHNEMIEMIKMFFVFFGGASVLFVFALLIEFIV